MIDKPLFIIIVMYCVSFMTLAGQFIIGDVFGLTLTNFRGEEIKSNLLTSFNENAFNNFAENISNATSYNSIVDVATAFLKAAEVFVELLAILAGAYIFMIIYYLLGGGLPPNCCDAGDAMAGFISSGLIIPYALLLANTIIAKIRGI